MADYSRPTSPQQGVNGGPVHPMFVFARGINYLVASQMADGGWRLAFADIRRVAAGSCRHIFAGERVAWTGPSGSGKTTLLHLIAGIMLSVAGRVESCGVELSGLSESARHNLRIAGIGLVFQEFELLDYLNVLDNILLAYHINRSLRLDATVRDRAHQLATEVGLAKFLFRRPTQLSHGERQRVAVCRALVTNPMLVLADEPTANLDSDNASRVLDALDRHVEHNEATLVVVTHDKDVTPRFDRTIDISAFCGTPQTTGGGGRARER